MIHSYKQGQPSLHLKPDLAGQKPIYIFWEKDKKSLLYSTSITLLLNNLRSKNPLEVSQKGLSFLLQSGFIPTPFSIFSKVYILGLGDTAEVSTLKDKIEVTFSHHFPFYSSNRNNILETPPNTEQLLELIAEATIDKLDESKDSFLFHSSGKDSNTIALALAQAGYQNKVNLLTHKANGAKDESQISARIAKKLGFKHRVISNNSIEELALKKSMDFFFYNSPFPSTDKVTLGYSQYAYRIPALKNSNIIDGGGNDSYMGILPNKKEVIALKIPKIISQNSILRKAFTSESVLLPSTRTAAEWFGITGLSFLDAKIIYPPVSNVYTYWKEQSLIKERKNLIDFKTSLFTPTVASELHIRKVRSFTDSIQSNLVLPFMDEKVALFFFNLPEEYLFDYKTKRNKLILRQLLKSKNVVDSDLVGKLGFAYDIKPYITNHLEDVFNEIKACVYWEKQGCTNLLGRLLQSMNSSGRKRVIGFSLIFNLYMISIWLNKNKYTN